MKIGKTRFGKLKTYKSKGGFSWKGRKILSGKNKGMTAIWY